MAYFIGGASACCIYAYFGRFKEMFANPMGYYLRCGLPCVLYPICLFLGFHLATKDEEIITLTVINYLWPQIMSILSIIIFRKQWYITLLLGLSGAFASILLVNKKPGMTLTSLPDVLIAIWPAATSCVFAAVCWAYYSVYAAWFSRENPEMASSVPCFTVISGVALLIAGRVLTEPWQGPFTITFYLAMIYLTVVPVCACRFAWDFACGKGDLMILNTYSYLTPCLATIWNIILLGVPFSSEAMYGSAGLAIAAVITKFSITEPKPKT